MLEQIINETTIDDNDDNLKHDMENKEDKIYNERLEKDQEELVFPIIKLVRRKYT